MTGERGSAVVGFALSISLVASAFVFLISLVQVLNAQSQLTLATMQAARFAARYDAAHNAAYSYLRTNYSGQLDCLTQEQVVVDGVSFLRVRTCDRIELSWLPLSVPISSMAKATRQT